MHFRGMCGVCVVTLGLSVRLGLIHSSDGFDSVQLGVRRPLSYDWINFAEADSLAPEFAATVLYLDVDAFRVSSRGQTWRSYWTT